MWTTAAWGAAGREFAQAAYHNFGPVQLGDQIAVLDQTLHAYPQLDPRRLGWWGWSWGGTFTLYALTHCDRFRSGVAVAPVTNWQNYDSIYTERYLGTPALNDDIYRDFSVEDECGQSEGTSAADSGHGRRQCAPGKYNPVYSETHRCRSAVRFATLSAQDPRHRWCRSHRLTCSPASWRIFRHISCRPLQIA